MCGLQWKIRSLFLNSFSLLGLALVKLIRVLVIRIGRLGDSIMKESESRRVKVATPTSNP